ncbi:ribosomal protein S2 [Helicocarpus griseus UAMH5409]|uniref:Ribosomal protein S2 n=1 Tax=Helicocarpus griseus UAMH5409 TaxID=1447875 RepID=A0A2B7XZM6_9EURO|nr:ribosomal protein S2 [Helicocarpus griseus UAMH5409]
MIIRRFFGRQGHAMLRYSAPRTTSCGRFFSTDSDSIPPPLNAQRSAPAATIVEEAAPPEPAPAKVPKKKAAEAGVPAAPEPEGPKFVSDKPSYPSPRLGSTVETAYDPEDLIRNPPAVQDITLELLLASQTHLGHATSLWNPANSQYIHGVRQGVHIISLDVTAAYLRRAAKVVREVARAGGVILFVGTRQGQRSIIVNAANRARACHVFDRWIPGSLTNSDQILGHCKKKVVNALDEELPGYDHKLATVPSLKPDLVVCVNPLENRPLLHECGLHTIPTIGIIDTDANPTHVTYPIPANDDSLRSVAVIAGVLGKAGEEGQAIRLKEAESGLVMYPRNSLLDGWTPRSAEEEGNEAGA